MSGFRAFALSLCAATGLAACEPAQSGPVVYHEVEESSVACDTYEVFVALGLESPPEEMSRRFTTECRRMPKGFMIEIMEIAGDDACVRPMRTQNPCVWIAKHTIATD